MNKLEIINIPLKNREYDIYIGDNLLEQSANIIKQKFANRKFAIITDENVAKYQLARLQNALQREAIKAETIIVKAGEGSKDFATLQKVIDKILALHLERQDMIIAFGGGVIGDLAGFAAAITRRGMDFIQIPTSLLAQIDSSVGGKTGINTKYGKNLVGAFHQPKLVLCDLQSLKTLPPRQFRAGYAEMVKYGLIDDEEFFFWLEENYQHIFAGNNEQRAKAIAHCCRAKSRFVIADEREANIRALLNLGHTFGHALEAVTGYSDRLIHGEAVAIGIVLAHKFSAKLGLIPSQDAIRVQKHLQLAGLPTTLEEIKGTKPTIKELLTAILQDKKIMGGNLTFILTKAIGKSFIATNIDIKNVETFLKEII